MFKKWEIIVHLDLSQLKIETGPQLVIKKQLKRDGQNIFENMCNRYTVTGKDIKKNGKGFCTLEVKEDFFVG